MLPHDKTTSNAVIGFFEMTAIREARGKPQGIGMVWQTFCFSELQIGGRVKREGAFFAQHQGTLHSDIFHMPIESCGIECNRILAG